MTVIFVPQPRPTHETIDRSFVDEDGRSISVSVRARIGQAEAPFKKLPRSWQVVTDTPLGPWETFGAISLLLVFGGFVLFFGTLLLGATGWLPYVPGRYMENGGFEWVEYVFPFYLQGVVIIIGLACLISVIWAIKRWVKP